MESGAGRGGVRYRVLLMVDSLFGGGYYARQTRSLTVYCNDDDRVYRSAFSYGFVFFRDGTRSTVVVLISVPFCPELNTPFEHRPGLLGQLHLKGTWDTPYPRDDLVDGHPGKEGGRVETRTTIKRGMGKVEEYSKVESDFDIPEKWRSELRSPIRLQRPFLFWYEVLDLLCVLTRLVCVCICK
jgi:hypothetical protein